MKNLNALVAIVFTVVGLSLITKENRLTPGLIALLIANISLVGIGIENVLDRNPVEIPEEEQE